MLPESLPCRRACLHRPLNPRLMKFARLLITALPDQSTPSIQRPRTQLEGHRGGEGARCLYPSCSLLEQCWEAGEKGHAGGPSLRSVLARSSQLSQRPHLRSFDPRQLTRPQCDVGVWRLAQCALYRPLGPQTHPRLPHGQCWPGSPVRASDQSRPATDWSGGAVRAAQPGASLSNSPVPPSRAVRLSPQPGPGQASG